MSRTNHLIVLTQTRGPFWFLNRNKVPNTRTATSDDSKAFKFQKLNNYNLQSKTDVDHDMKSFEPWLKKNSSKQVRLLRKGNSKDSEIPLRGEIMRDIPASIILINKSTSNKFLSCNIVQKSNH